MSIDLKKPIPPNIRKKASLVISHALRDMSYKIGINQLEKYRKLYSFDDKLLYALGLLYDHKGMQISGQFYSQGESVKISIKQKKKAEYYFKTAREIFYDILKRNPKNVYALFRCGILFELNEQYRKAIKFKLKAYRIGMKDKSKRIPLLIGFTYLKMGEKKEAEKWIQKELKFLGEENTSANLNILLFYFLIKEYKKASLYIPQVEKILKSQRKTIGKKVQKLWQKRIQKIKKMANP